MARRRILNIIGGNFRRVRKSKGLTQADVVARCQVMGWQLSRETLAKIETEVRRVNDAEVVMLAKAVSVKIDKLLSSTDEQCLFIARHSPACE